MCHYNSNLLVFFCFSEYSTYRTQEGSFTCPKCNVNYLHQRSLHRHLNFECGKPPQFECSYCGRKLRHKFHLRNHMFSCKRNPMAEINKIITDGLGFI